MEKNYAFVVCVNGKPMKTFKWCSPSEKEMRMQAAAMCTGARVFKKTSAVLVYELKGEAYKLIHSCEWSNKWHAVAELPCTSGFREGYLIGSGNQTKYDK